MNMLAVNNKINIEELSSIISESIEEIENNSSSNEEQKKSEVMGELENKG